MEREGWRVVRFWASEVVQNPEGMWAEIEQVVGGSPPHLTSPLAGEREHEGLGQEARGNFIPPSCRWHDAQCPDFTSRSAGTSVRQRGMA